MKRTFCIAKRIALAAFCSSVLVLIAAPSTAKVKELISANNVGTSITDGYLIVTADLLLDSLDLKSNRQVLITPIVEGGLSDLDSDSISQNALRDTQTEILPDSITPDEQRTTKNEIILPSVLVNGRNMHISYERGVLRNFPALKGIEIQQELRRYNGTHQRVEYIAKVPIEPWMTGGPTRLSLRYDPCGCGVASAPEIYNAPIPPVEEEEIEQEPEVPFTNAKAVIPEINIPDVHVHAGKARIQFEVDRTVLHVEPFVCRNGQRLDNRTELKVIDDSVKYALSDPNVELVGIDICGYASPESPYLHNVELADGRSKVLAEYLADRYNLPRDAVTYSSVPENWGEFREMVVASEELTDSQRQLLLDLIDTPASTPKDYDRKEWLLKTDSRYSKLYKSKILPEWFPRLRATTFALKTQLKDMDDEHLREVFKTSPGKMSLQQLCRVAALYDADSDEFNEVVTTALAKYPKEQVAIVNAAIGAMAKGDYDEAKALLKNAEQTSEVYRLLALIADVENDTEAAAHYREMEENTKKQQNP